MDSQKIRADAGLIESGRTWPGLSEAVRQGFVDIAKSYPSHRREGEGIVFAEWLPRSRGEDWGPDLAIRGAGRPELVLSEMACLCHQATEAFCPMRMAAGTAGQKK